MAGTSGTIKADIILPQTSGKGLGIKGVTDGSAATAGDIGEVISSGVSRTGTSLTTNITLNVTSITLTAGDWDVRGVAGFKPAASTAITYYEASISLTSAVNPSSSKVANPSGNETYISLGAQGLGSIDSSVSIPPYTVSLSTTTVLYLNTTAGFTVSTLSTYGSLQARRIR